MSSEKTEQPTPHKLKQARQKGTVTKSTDLVSAALLAAAIAAFEIGGGPLLDALRQAANVALEFCTSDRSSQALASGTLRVLGLCAVACGVFAVACAVASSVATFAQAGFVFTLETVMPKLERVSPQEGIKRIFSARALLDIARMTIKAILLGVLLWNTTTALLPLVTRALFQPLPQLSALLWGTVLHVLTVSLVMYTMIGAADWKLQQWLTLRSQRMTKEEVKREHKEQEGNPKVKHERRKRGRELVRGDNIPEAIGRANAVVVNPTHYAVALRYAPAEYPLPVVLAKGVDAQAMEIRQLATQLDVPIVANPPVARALYRVETGRAIPPELFEVVAAILRWVASVRPTRASDAGDGGARVSHADAPPAREGGEHGAEHSI